MDRASGARAGLEMRSIAARHRVAEDCLISAVDRGTPSTRRGPDVRIGPESRSGHAVHQYPCATGQFVTVTYH
jgi:hypothetical protein